jgi:hypothetical protein
MKKRSSSESGAFNPRVFLALILCLVGASLGMGALIVAAAVISVSALLPVLSFATITPSSGLLTDTSGPLTFTGGPYVTSDVPSFEKSYINPASILK